MNTNIRHSILAAALLCGTTAHAQDVPKTIFREPFDTKEDFEKWTIVNVEEGSVTWTYRTSTGKPMQSKCAQILKHSPNAAEDWLISPEFRLEAGNLYEVSFRMTPGTFNKAESLKAYMGTGTDAASMTDLLISIDEVVRDDSADITYRVEYTPSDSGTYRIGFLGCSQPDRGRIDLDDVTIVLKQSQPAPGIPTDLSIEPSADDPHKITLSFRAPTVDSKGEWLESIAGIRIRRGDTLLAEIEAPRPGSQLQYTDTEAPDGLNTYSVAAYTGKEGEAAMGSVYTGTDIPTSPSALRADYDGSRILLSWQAPAEGIHNGAFDPAALEYTVTLEGQEEPVATLSGVTEYEYSIDPVSPQHIYNFSVAATSAAGSSEVAAFPRVAAGKALDAPLNEGFDKGSENLLWYGEGAFPWTTDGALTAEISEAEEGSASRFISPLVNLATLSNPVLRFSIKSGPTERLSIQVRAPGAEWEEMPLPEWEGSTECMVPFTQRGTVQLSFLASGGGEAIHLDDIRIEEAGWTSDVAIISASASKRRATVGENTSFIATLRNLGATATGDYTLTLLRDGEEVATVEGPTLQPSEIFPYTILYTATYDDQYKDKSQWSFRLESKGDQRPQNDVSTELGWSARGCDVPAPEGLAGQCSAGGVALTWNAAEDVEEGVQGSPIVVNEDFEGYEPFLKDVAGEWTILDLDKAPTWRAQYPDYGHKGEPMAFQVFNTEQGGTQTGDFLDRLMTAHSGKQYMLCVGNSDISVANDDWLITPRLDGRAQTVRFYCSAPQPFNRPDKMRVGYSTTDTHPDSFTMLGGEYTLPADDTRWSFDLPEGARRFAINVTYCNTFIKVDDVTYARWDGRPDPLTVEGYNVYRDGNRLNAELLSEPQYRDTEAAHGTAYTYTVTTVYEQGESAYSAPLALTADLSAVESIATESPHETGRFTPDGLPAPANYRGTVIIRYSDGTTRKAIAR